jgi:hypothetical protein
MDERNEQEKDQQGVIIHDLRHSRAEEAALAEEEQPEAEPEVPASESAGQEPEPQPAEPEPAEREPEAPPERSAPAAGLAGDAADDLPPELADATEQERLEYQQLRMIFGMGLKGYLAGQLTILINFALIYLGRAPNPATGLVATDLEGARTAIDLLEKTLVYVASELQPEEQANLKKLVGDLKFSYLQAAGGSAPVEG